MSASYELTPDEVEQALKEAKARGLPDGWDVKLDKRKRRKWISPNGRTVDSIPKALAMSIELGMVSPGAILPSALPQTSANLSHLTTSSVASSSTVGTPDNNTKRKHSGTKLPMPSPIDPELAALLPAFPVIKKRGPGRPSKKAKMLMMEQQRQIETYQRLHAQAMKKRKGGDDAADNDETEDEDDYQFQQQQRQQRLLSAKKAAKAVKAQPSSPPALKPKRTYNNTVVTNVYSQTQYKEGDDDDKHNHDNDDNADDSDDEETSTEPPTNPETTFLLGKSHLTTVHWDPKSIEGRRIGWRIRIADGNSDDWKDGRIMRYDPCTHKHKIQFADETRSVDRVDADNCAWIHLRMEDGVQIATKLVWAHVKGYAWWPAMIMDSDAPRREGYMTVEFFGTGEVATLRDGPECLRPFVHGQVDDVISKNKKKRNAKAIQLALDEEDNIHRVRNDAAKYYATHAFFRNAHAGNLYVGKRVQIFRDDVNYPYGDTVSGKVKQYSKHQKKWLISYELSNKVRKKYEASWINLKNKEHKMRLLEKKTAPVEPKDLDIVPFLLGFGYRGNENLDDDPPDGSDANIAKIFKQRCRGCTDYFKSNTDFKLKCSDCQASYHIGCIDPPMLKDDYQRLLKTGDTSEWKCSKCTHCRGCYQKDITFGCHVQPVPRTLLFPEDETFALCSMCTKLYEKKRFCPNCAHSWDDQQLQRVQRQTRWMQAHRPKKRGRKRKHEDPNAAAIYDDGMFSAPATSNLDDPEPVPGAKVNHTWYYPETLQWGFTEDDMLTCDSCGLWVHAGCAGMNEDEYYETSQGTHPIYGKEFLCRVCCRTRCLDIINKLQVEDSMLLFAEPVTDRVAANYLDIIKNPMDLQTLAARVNREEYMNYAWVRDMFELMVFNALKFNHPDGKIWSEAKRFHKACVTKIFSVIGKAAPRGKYSEAVENKFMEAEEAKKKEVDRVQQDDSTEKKDLVAGNKVAKVTLPDLRETPPDLSSCMTFKEILLKPVDAFYNCWMDCCFTCGSCGSSDTMLFCVDCGESFHSFCVSAPVHCMDAAAVASWRCPNCKICEISGDAPQDELKMLFCEMCDRAFSLDLLDPPLQSAPSGLWICGQCVDCEKCKNTAEPHGASLNHWSRDPKLCYRCGGCDGLVEQYIKGKRCPVCSILWRDEDEDLAECEECGSKVHAKCDARASHYLLNGSSKNAKSGDSQDKYHCPTCCKKQGTDADFGKVTRDHMHDFSWKIIIQGILKPGVESSHLELQEKLMDQVDWKTRNLYRDEYRKVVLEGVRFLDMAREQYGDPRLLMDRFWRENLDLPTWMGQRATRFIHIAKRLKLSSQGFSARRIENCVLISKLAASWLKVACRTLEINTKRNVKGYERARKLLVPPDPSGAILLPFDSIRCERNRNIINKDEWIEKYDPKLQPLLKEGIPMSAIVDEEPEGAKETANKSTIEYELAQPLCGWNDLLEENMSNGDREWKDPRECCLCHTCGDDDAGLENDSQDTTLDPDSDLKVPKLGRLLPLGEGYWVHSSCALWSSETWEAPSGGLLNAMEKARSRGAQLKCFGCGRSGATVGCSKTNCSFNYHFPCACAVGCVFTTKKQMYCVQHKDSTIDVMPQPSVEHMKTLIVAPEKSKPSASDHDPSEAIEGNLCIRVGALVVHSLGQIERNTDSFHSEDYITPRGYIASRIFWSASTPRKRTVYILKIEKADNGHPIFSATPGDNPSYHARGHSADEVYRKLIHSVEATNKDHYSQGDPRSKLPTRRLSRKKIFGLNGSQFFGFGLNQIRRALEMCPGVEAVIAALSPASPVYRFCFSQPSVEMIVALQRERAAIAAEKELENISGCARTEGMKAVARSGGSGRITRALVRNADNEQGGADLQGRKGDEETARADRSINQKKYREMKSVSIEQRLDAKRSHIHGWGLFSKIDLPKDSMVVEYMGESVRRCVADKREKGYEISGEGSCYMFRLDLLRIVDATVIGCMARFMNHSCQPNAYAKVITVETDLGPEKKIMVFSKCAIAANEEITYDYKFPVENGSLKCTCGAPNCIGRMN